MLQAERLRLVRGDLEVLKGVSLTLKAGELVALMGPSGVGKSSLLQVLMGSLPPTGGIVRLTPPSNTLPPAGSQISLELHDLYQLSDEARILLHRHVIGTVGQEFQLLPRLDVLRNVALPLLLHQTAPAQALARAHDVLQSLQLQSLATRPAYELSRGQQQRVALARALVYPYPLLLLDEPDASLDAQTRDQVLEHFRARARAGAAVLFSTHDPASAAQADRILTLDSGWLRDAPTASSSEGTI